MCFLLPVNLEVYSHTPQQTRKETSMRENRVRARTCACAHTRMTPTPG
jgi:hypothetical protein